MVYSSNNDYQAREKFIDKVLDNITVFKNGDMAFKKHFQNKDGSVMGWYAID